MARYALVVGIAEYDSSSLPTLKKSATDAEAVARVLEQSGTFQEVIRLPRRWIKDENRYEVISKRLTGDDLIQALRTFLLEQTTKQEALIYFAGHGFQALSSMGLQKGYLATSNCATDGRNAIPLDEFNWLISQSDLSSLVVLLDCCHAGSLLERNLLEPTLTAFETKPDYYFITACRSFEKAYEGAEHGIFTGAILKGLSAENADEDDQVSSERLFDSIRRDLKGSGQEPIRMGRGRSITLVTYVTTNPAADPPPVSASPPVQPASQFSRSGVPITKLILQDLWVSPWILLGMVLLPLFGGIILLLPKSPSTLPATEKPKRTLIVNADQDQCENLPRKPGTLLIAIAKFDKDSPDTTNNLKLENKLLSELVEQEPPDVEVCHTTQEVLTTEQAKKLGEALGASVIIWGSLDQSVFEVSLTVVSHDPPRRITLPGVSPKDFLEPSFQTKDLPQLVEVLTKFTLTQIYLLNKKPDQARKTLAAALEKADLQGLGERNKRNAEVLAKAYYFLGTSFDTLPNPNCKDCSNQAFKAYKRAFELDGTLHFALLNQAKFYQERQELGEAMKVYDQLISSQLIKSKPRLVATALVNRAALFVQQNNRKAAEADYNKAISIEPLLGHKARAQAYLMFWNNPKEAVKDLMFVRDQESENPDNYHNLGLAQLQAGQTLQAKQTYQSVLCYFDEDSRVDMLDDLKLLAKQKPQQAEVINGIASTIKKAPIPSIQKQCDKES